MLVSLLFRWIQWTWNRDLNGSTLNHYLWSKSITTSFVTEYLKKGTWLFIKTVKAFIYNINSFSRFTAIGYSVTPVVRYYVSHSSLITVGSHRLDWCVATGYARSLCRENSPGCRSQCDQIPHYIPLCSSRIHTRRVPLFNSWSSSLCKHLSALQQFSTFLSLSLVSQLLTSETVWIVGFEIARKWKVDLWKSIP